MTESHDDFDSPWKNTLEWYFEDFMAFFFPDAHADIDWSKPVEFLDKELQQVVSDAKLGRRYADKLVKVWKKNGDEQWVLAHVEVQGEPETHFERRMYSYNYRIFDKYNRPVASFAVLADDRAAWRPEKFSYTLWGCTVSFVFPICKLIDYQTRWAELEASDNPFATVVMAHLKTLETQRNPQARYNAKFTLIRRLYERGYERNDVIRLFGFIDWIMHLPQELEVDFWAELRHYEGRNRMEYITSVQRIGMTIGIEIGMEKGIQTGLQKGALLVLLRLLDHRFGPVSEEMVQRLHLLSAEEAEKLVDVALTANDIDELARYLPEPAQNTVDES